MEVKCISGDEICDNSDCIVTLTHLLADFNEAAGSHPSQTATTLSSSGIEMLDLWKIKANPCASSWNMRFDNTFDACREISRVNLPRQVYVDLSTSSFSQRNHHALLSLSTQLQNADGNAKYIRIVSCTDPGKIPIHVGESIVRMKNEILLGYDHKHYTGASNENLVRAGAIHCSLVNHPFSYISDLVAYEDMLQACATAQFQLSRYSSPDLHHGPPIFISLGYASTLHVEVLDILSRHNAIIGQVVFMDVLASSSSIASLERILKYPGQPSICIDSFGLASTYLPESFGLKSLPSDDEIVQTVVALCLRGYQYQLILSTNIRSKIQMRYYGGHGYEWLSEAIILRLHDSGISADTASLITGKSLLTRLSWYLAPKPAEVPIDKLTCYICQQEFIPGNHYQKFDHVYCSKTCLATHRQRNWK
jgi:hypothetical protein